MRVASLAIVAMLVVLFSAPRLDAQHSLSALEPQAQILDQQGFKPTLNLVQESPPAGRYNPVYHIFPYAGTSVLTQQGFRATLPIVGECECPARPRPILIPLR